MAQAQGGLTQLQASSAPDPSDPNNVGDTFDNEKAVPPAPALVATKKDDFGASDYAAERAKIYRQQQKLMQLLEEKAKPNANAGWSALARGFADPNAKWFYQGLAGGVGNLKQQQEDQDSKAIQLAQMRMQLGQGMYAQQAQDVELRKQQAIQKLSESLVSPTGVIDKAVLQQMVSIDPKYTSTVIDSSQKIKKLLEPDTKIIKNDENLIQMGADGNWKVVLGGVEKLDFATKLALQQLNIPIANINNLTPDQSNSLQARIKANATNIDTDVNEAMTVLGIPLTRINALTQKEREDIDKHILAKKTASAPKTTITVTNEAEKAFFRDIGTEEAKRITASHANATSAPDLIDSSNRTRELLEGGNVLTGPFAGIKLVADRLVGDPKRVQATQEFLNEQSRNTLAGIKSSNLGSGQGFTNTDREFLKEATTGNITWDRKSLLHLADINEMLARNHIKMFNKEYEVLSKNNPKALTVLPTFRPVEEPAYKIPRDPYYKNNPYHLSSIQSLAEEQRKQIPDGEYFIDWDGKGYIKEGKQK